MKSSRTGKAIPNQFIIDGEYFTYFQSYDSIIAKIGKTRGLIYLDKTYWDYSVTTSKYRNQFLNETTEETKEKIKDGTYILTDLNK